MWSTQTNHVGTNICPSNFALRILWTSIWWGYVKMYMVAISNETSRKQQHIATLWLLLLLLQNHKYRWTCATRFSNRDQLWFDGTHIHVNEVLLSYTLTLSLRPEAVAVFVFCSCCRFSILVYAVHAHLWVDHLLCATALPEMILMFTMCTYSFSDCCATYKETTKNKTHYYHRDREH